MLIPEPYELEEERIKELESFSILDTLSEEDYDNLTILASEICETPISLISLIDDKRQWFKSHCGLSVNQTPKEYAFCAHAINDPDQLFMVQDARKDLRFQDNPLVTGDPHVIFYAGVPLVTENGYPLGTLCVIDHKPKTLTSGQQNSLKALSKQVMNLLHLRKSKLLTDKLINELELKNKELEQFAYVAAHDIKSPLCNINMLSSTLVEDFSSNLDDTGQTMLSMIRDSSKKLISLVDGLLEFSRSNCCKHEKSRVQVNQLIDDMNGLLNYENNLRISLNSEIDEISIIRSALEQILINLISNAIKYNHNNFIEIQIDIDEKDGFYVFFVQDNGWGIRSDKLDKIFEIFEIAAVKDKFGKSGNGIGLATVQNLVQSQGGEISVVSSGNSGTKFKFTIKKD